jgi:acyl carrier protein
MNLAAQIAAIIHQRLELPGEPATLAPTRPLFVPAEHGGLGIDSIAALEVIAALSDHFDLPFDDVADSDLFCIAALAAYVERHRPAEATP